MHLPFWGKFSEPKIRGRVNGDHILALMNPSLKSGATATIISPTTKLVYPPPLRNKD